MGDRGRQLPHRRDAVRMRQLNLYLAVTLFAFSDFRLRPLAVGDVHVGSDEFDNLAGGVINRMTYFLDVLRCAIRKVHLKIQFVLCSVTDCSVRRFGKSGSVRPVDALQKVCEWRYARLRIEAVQSVDFPRPVGDLSGRGVPPPAAGMAQPLPFLQVGLAPLQGLLFAFAIGEVAGNAPIAGKPTLGIKHWLAADRHKAKRTVDAPDLVDE